MRKILLFILLPVFYFGQNTEAILLDSAISCELAHNYEGAISFSSKAIVLNPNYAYAYSNRGFSFLMQEMYEEAITDFDKAISLNKRPKHFERPKLINDSILFFPTIVAFALYNKLDFPSDKVFKFLTHKEYKGFIPKYNGDINLDYNTAFAFHNKGFAQAKLKKWDDAISSYTKGITIFPNSKTTYYNRACALASKGNTVPGSVLPVSKPEYYRPSGSLKYYFQAIKDFTTAIDFDTNYTAAYINRGNAYLLNNKFFEAINDFKKALELISYCIKF